MTVVTAMMMASGVRRNYRAGQDDECDGSKKKRAQFHKGIPLRQPLFE
jgi:hypothetical protein